MGHHTGFHRSRSSWGLVACLPSGDDNKWNPSAVLLGAREESPSLSDSDSNSVLLFDTVCYVASSPRLDIHCPIARDFHGNIIWQV